jgi:hypothetical protein
MVQPAKRGAKSGPSDVEKSTEEPGSELTTRILSESDLRDITDVQSAMDILTKTLGVNVIEAREELGDGFEFIENKEILVGIPVLFVKWETHYSTSYTRDKEPLRSVQAWVVFERGGQPRKARFVDFSTGVCQQLWEYTDRTGRQAGLAAPLGLRKSEFMYTDPSSGEQSAATTYYIDLSNPNR